MVMSHTLIKNESAWVSVFVNSMYTSQKASNNPNCLHKDDEYVHMQITQYVHIVKVPVVKTMNVPSIIVTSCIYPSEFLCLTTRVLRK